MHHTTSLVRRVSWALLALAFSVPVGCDGDEPGTEAATAAAGEETPVSPESPAASGRGFQPVKLAGFDENEGAEADAATFTREDVRRALNPLQIMIGSWTVIPSKSSAGVGKIITADWAWDYETDPKRPALVFESEHQPYLRSGRLTYFPEREKYQLVAEIEDGEKVTLEGDFTQEARKVEGDNGQMQMTYKLELVQVEDGKAPPRPWKTTFTQANNNRYRVNVITPRSSVVLASQRKGTSFTRSFDDYGDRECIVSQGLGTITVSYEGQTYYVCCSGCKAAFEDDPETWIAKLEERKKK